MASVLVTGVPNVKMNKVLFVLKAMFTKNNLPNTFWIREFLDDHRTGMKKMTVAFDTIHDAHDALKFLDGFLFRQGGAQYAFSARVMEDRRRRSPSPFMPYRERTPDRRFNRRHSINRSRSRSPLHHHSDASQLDLEIELLRKRRLIIEEERRLLLERKKLDLVREYGPGAAKEFDYFEERGREYEHRPFERERRRSVERFRRRSMERERNIRRPRSPPKRSKLPMFVLPCRLLIQSMKPSIKECTSGKESDIIVNLIRSTLRKRIAVALEGKGRLSTASIITLYRKFYPVNTDEDLVKKLAKNIKASQIPNLTSKTGAKAKETKIKEEQKEKKEEVKKDEEISDADNVKDLVEVKVAKEDNVDQTADGSGGEDETVEEVEAIITQIKEEESEETTAKVNSEPTENEAEELPNNVNDKEWVEGGSDWNEVEKVNGDDVKE